VLWSLKTQSQRVSVLMPRPMVGVWFEKDHLRTLDDLGAQWIWSLDTLTSTTRFDNLRVCRGTTDVVPVIPFGSDTVWAPKALCYAPNVFKDYASKP
jgi:hypothetical protein